MPSSSNHMACAPPTWLMSTACALKSREEATALMPATSDSTVPASVPSGITTT